jgi:DNA replicative helicase MCM subunit Mcm2 (Cdc46/Mcm family)
MMIDSNQPTTTKNYKHMVGLFGKFLLEHTILIRQNNGSCGDDRDDDSFMEELPTSNMANSVSLRRIPAFRDHLQRIKDGRFYNNSEQRVFLIEIPLSELVAWDAIRGADLAQRATRNTLRYQELFCNALDETLALFTESSSSSSSNRNNATTGTNDDDAEGGGGNVVNSIDVLNQHRLAIQQAAIREQEARRAVRDGVRNPYAGRNQVQGENVDENGNGSGGNGNNNNATNATEEIPAVLLRRYELRILPLGRRGTLPPFAQQHIPKQVTTSAADSSYSYSHLPPPEALSLRAIRSNCLGRLVTVRGMVVRTSKVQPCTVVATYSCDACGGEIYQPVSTREFMPPRSCEYI